MRYSNWFIKALLEQYGLDGREGFLQKILPLDMSTCFSNLPAASLGGNPERFIFFRSTLLQKMHITWQQEILDSLPLELQKVATAIVFSSECTHSTPYEKDDDLISDTLSHEANKKDSDLYSLHEQRVCNKCLQVSLDPELKKLTLEAALQNTSLLNIEPIEALVESDFRWFLDASYDMKIKIIDLVAVYDVTEEIRQIVDKKTLHIVLSLLTESQQRYLKSLLHMQLKLTKEPLDLLVKIRQGVERDVIRSFIHERGLLRLAQILKEEESLFRWYLLHNLDVHRAKWIEKCMSEKYDQFESSQDLLRKGDIRSVFQHASQFIKLEMSKMSGFNRG